MAVGIMLFNPPSGACTDTRTAVDQVGRTVTFPAHPERVISLAPSITEIVFAIDRGECLKGATVYSDYPESARRIPRVGSYVHLDLEKIVALEPDLCIAVKDGNPKQTADRLSDLGIPVYAVNPVDLDSVITTVTLIGSLLNAETRAAQVVNDMETRVRRVEALVATTTVRPRVFFQIGISPIVSAGRDTFIHGLIERAGGINLAAAAVAYPRFSREQFLGLAPDIIIITSMARAEVFERVKKEWESWSGLPAVKNNQVHIVDSNLLDRPTPRMVEGLELLVRLIHPELF
ncbi:ABC-type Fe(3+) transport system, periplasmic substrate binding component [Desulforapulum autotrophicum HRM2]|uniref:ABC-type Fe(3+) transport system, periplasmic substrate binding component n=2 Tax=Desulforapulum autotrophicum TaxID=2296 RepID=C0QD02_DESAH|nr:ABC-type Fe(3+) transport system, periplasmic substrate binding component [Desulforapulum autotrophicum HRM2]